MILAHRAIPAVVVAVVVVVCWERLREQVGQDKSGTSGLLL